MPNRYDLAIIGGGAGAFAAAIKANQLGAKTVLINSGLPLGGTCVNVGCVPSKTLLHAAQVLHQSRGHGVPGLKLGQAQVDFAKIVQDELNLVEHMRHEKYTQVLKGLNHVSHIAGHAKFTSPGAIKVNDQTVQADKFIIATGSTATIPPIKGLSEAGFLTHIEAVKHKKLPKSLVVIGGGPLGLEFAQMYARFGTQVTILQKAASLAPGTEPIVAQRLHEVLKSEGLKIATGVEVEQVTQQPSGEKVVHYKVNGQTQTAKAEEILLAAGKTPNTAELGLDSAGVALGGGQAVKVKPNLQTSQANIYAVGDVADLPLRQETTAGREGTLAAQNALTGSQQSINYQHVPYTIFTDPQLAGVGLTEAEQAKQTGTCACRTVPFTQLPRGIINRRTEGVIKMVINPKNQQIVGVHVLAPNASDIAAQAMVLIANKNTVTDAANLLPVFPSESEAIKLAALAFSQDISKVSCCV